MVTEVSAGHAMFLMGLIMTLEMTEQKTVLPLLMTIPIIIGELLVIPIAFGFKDYKGGFQIK